MPELDTGTNGIVFQAGCHVLSGVRYTIGIYATHETLYFVLDALLPFGDISLLLIYPKVYADTSCFFSIRLLTLFTLENLCPFRVSRYCWLLRLVHAAGYPPTYS